MTRRKTERLARCARRGKRFDPSRSGMREFCVSCREWLDWHTVGVPPEDNRLLRGLDVQTVKV
jgi:hypothetical protein